METNQNETGFKYLKLINPVKLNPSFDELAAVRLEDNFALPFSYCDFASNFGYGLLCELFYIFVPGSHCDNLADESAGLKELIAEWVEEDLIDEYWHDTTPELVKNLIPFGTSKNGNTLAWNPNEKTAPDEYQIYVFSAKMVGVRRATPNLYEFVESCADERGKDFMGSGFQPLPLTFNSNG
jgi:hypothetical protein